MVFVVGAQITNILSTLYLQCKQQQRKYIYEVTKIILFNHNCFAPRKLLAIHRGVGQEFQEGGIS